MAKFKCYSCGGDGTCSVCIGAAGEWVGSDWIACVPCRGTGACPCESGKFDGLDDFDPYIARTQRLRAIDDSDEENLYVELYERWLTD